jgi:hypothetical protein
MWFHLGGGLIALSLLMKTMRRQFRCFAVTSSFIDHPSAFQCNGQRLAPAIG